MLGTLLSSTILSGPIRDQLKEHARMDESIINRSKSGRTDTNDLNSFGEMMKVSPLPDISESSPENLKATLLPEIPEQLPQNLNTKPIENAAEVDKNRAPRDSETLIQSTTETELFQNKDLNAPRYSGKICYSVEGWSDVDLRQHLHDSH